jgi:hypothetical protein
VTNRRRRQVVAFVLLAGTSACAKKTTVENHVFFQTDAISPNKPFEVAFPPLDLAEQPGRSAYVGVAVLGGSVRFSRPISWRIRRARNTLGFRFVEYSSPHEYLFALYERTDSTGSCTSWSDVLPQYEDDAKKVVDWWGKAIPIAGYDTQGREYVLRRKVSGQRAPYINTSREFIFHGAHSWVLVELVHQGRSPALVEKDVLRTIETLSVL